MNGASDDVVAVWLQVSESQVAAEVATAQGEGGGVDDLSGGQLSSVGWASSTVQESGFIDEGNDGGGGSGCGEHFEVLIVGNNQPLWWNVVTTKSEGCSLKGTDSCESTNSVPGDTENGVLGSCQQVAHEGGASLSTVA